MCITSKFKLVESSIYLSIYISIFLDVCLPTYHKAALYIFHIGHICIKSKFKPDQLFSFYLSIFSIKLYLFNFLHLQKRAFSLLEFAGNWIVIKSILINTILDVHCLTKRSWLKYLILSQFLYAFLLIAVLIKSLMIFKTLLFFYIHIYKIRSKVVIRFISHSETYFISFVQAYTNCISL